jgi:hypothetical protein
MARFRLYSLVPARSSARSRRDSTDRASFPTLRALLKGSGAAGRATRSPFYAGYPTRAQAAFTQRLKRK